MAFEIIEPSGVDESAVVGPASGIARSLAAAKAEAVLPAVLAGTAPPKPSLLVLGADTVVAVETEEGERVLGKPRDPGDARNMLRLLSGRSHRVWTGVAVARPGFPTAVEVEESEVRFRVLAPGVIDAYIATGEPFGKAGAYAIQGAGEALVAGFRGCFYNIVGLPLVLVSRLLGVPSPACDCAAHARQLGKPGCGL